MIKIKNLHIDKFDSNNPTHFKIDRTTKFGNPYKNVSRSKSIKMYEKLLESDTELQKALKGANNTIMTYQTIYKKSIDRIQNMTIKYDDYDVKEGETYYYRVRTVSENASATSKLVFIKFKGNPPSSVAQFSASVHSMKKQVNLSWKAAANALEYRIYRAYGNGNFVQIATTKGTTYDDADSKLKVNQNYRYSVRACNAWGIGLDSQIKTICFAGKKPDVPTKLKYTFRNNAISLSWENCNKALSYYVQKKIIHSTMTWSNEVSCASCFYEDKEVQKDSGYYYRVCAVNEWGRSGFCEEIPAWAKSPDYSVNRKGIIIAVTVPPSDSKYANEKKRREINCNNISNTFKKNGIKNVTVFNKTLEQLNTALLDFAKEVDADDVSYVYVNCHSGYDSMGLGYTDGGIRYISLISVRELLDQIPGKKILLFDTCHSGQAIAEDEKNSSSTRTRKLRKEETNQSALFLQNMISAFQPKKTAMARKSEMRKDKYYVLCSSTEDELSYGDLIYGNRATRYWCEGGGWNYKEQKEDKYYADSNGNNVVTLEELYQYSYDKVVEISEDTQHVVRWPEGSTEKVFGK